MFDEEIDPLPRAFDPEGRPALLVEESLPSLPVQAFKFVGALRGVEFDALHLDPISGCLADGPGQAFGFFLVH